MNAVEKEAPLAGMEREARDDSSRRPYARFFAGMFLPALLLYVAAFPLVRTPRFERWCPSKWGPMLEWAFDARQQNADVVIFGDSSAFLGVDPRTVNQALGVRSVVLPNTIGSLPVIGDLALRNYLRNNRAPRLIVFYFSPWNLDYGRVQDAKLFEGEEMMLRHSSPAAMGQFAWHHPLDAVSFPLRLYSTFGPEVVRSLLHGDDREQRTADALGHVDDPDDFPPVAKPCELPRQYFRADTEDSVRELTRRYATAQTEVMVYLAPVPDCVNAATFARQAAAHFGLAAPAELPSEGFVGDGYYAHMKPAAVPASSRLLVDALRSRVAALR